MGLGLTPELLDCDANNVEKKGDDATGLARLSNQVCWRSRLADHKSGLDM